MLTTPLMLTLPLYMLLLPKRWSGPVVSGLERSGPVVSGLPGIRAPASTWVLAGIWGGSIPPEGVEDLQHSLGLLGLLVAPPSGCHRCYQALQDLFLPSVPWLWGLGLLKILPCCFSIFNSFCLATWSVLCAHAPLDNLPWGVVLLINSV